MLPQLPSALSSFMANPVAGSSGSIKYRPSCYNTQGRLWTYTSTYHHAAQTTTTNRSHGPIIVLCPEEIGFIARFSRAQGRKTKRFEFTCRDCRSKGRWRGGSILDTHVKILIIQTAGLLIGAKSDVDSVLEEVKK
jgi:hypothetical protein